MVCGGVTERRSCSGRWLEGRNGIAASRTESLTQGKRQGGDKVPRKRECREIPSAPSVVPLLAGRDVPCVKRF